MNNSILLVDNFYARKSLQESNGDCIYDVKDKTLNELIFIIHVQKNGHMFIRFCSKKIKIKNSIRILNKFSEYLLSEGITPMLKIINKNQVLQYICRRAGYRQKGCIFTFKNKNV